MGIVNQTLRRAFKTTVMPHINISLRTGRATSQCMFLGVLLSFVSLMTSCSYFASFVVINDTGQPVQVRYRVMKSTVGPIVSNGVPSVISASRLDSKGGMEWQELPPSRYDVDSDKDEITVR